VLSLATVETAPSTSIQVHLKNMQSGSLTEMMPSTEMPEQSPTTSIMVLSLW